MKIAKERRSEVLASNAVHHRVDSLTSIVALLTIGGSHVFTDASWLDPVGGLIISMMVVRAGWANTKASVLELADVGIDEDTVISVEEAASKAIGKAPNGEEIAIRRVQGIKSGQNYLMEVELAVPGSWSVEQTRNVEQLVQERVAAKVRGVRRLRIRFLPDTETDHGLATDFIPRDVSPRSTPEPEIEANCENGSVSSDVHTKDSGAHKRR
jgi:divalent metal cation (Fe/Co/Zn/Cd) transporter